MGAAMARRFVGTGHSVRLWNRTPETAERIAGELGARRAASPAEAVSGAEVVVSMLADETATTEVLIGKDLLRSLPTAGVVCDMATSGVDAAQRLADAYAKAGHLFLDAPVSGSVATVEAGGLLVMASGDPEALPVAEPVLSSIAKHVIFLGGAGAGQAMKLSVNLVVHTLNSAISEALALAGAAGVTPDAAYDVFEHSVVAAPFVHYKRRAFLDPEAPVAMSLELMAKDLRLITSFARAQAVDARVADAVRASVDAACAAGLQADDMAALYRYLTVTRDE
jgi:3-hydroxyisobutyrate dehydrogenase-like beta-hydroxyacid dehydrogenase